MQSLRQAPEIKVATAVSQSDFTNLIPALRAFSRTFCRNTVDADDLVQETLMKGIAAVESFQPGTNLKSWLFTIMRNTFYTRAKLARRESPGLMDCASARPTMPASQDWSQRGREIAQAIDDLPEDQRQVVMLIGVLGVSYDDAATICHCAIGTIKSRLNRARARLLQNLGETSTREAVLTPVVRPS